MQCGLARKGSQVGAETVPNTPVCLLYRSECATFYCLVKTFDPSTKTFVTPVNTQEGVLLQLLSRHLTQEGQICEVVSGVDVLDIAVHRLINLFYLG